MLQQRFFLLCLCISLLAYKSKASQFSLPKDPISKQVDSLLAMMTLEEKIGQMTQITITALENPNNPGVLDPIKLKEAIQIYKIGSILNVPNPAAPTTQSWHKILSQIQKETLGTDRKIPILYGIDAIHGANYTAGATLMPQQIGMAATWNTDLVQRATSVSAYETKASGIPWVFSPDLDLPRHSAWSRLWETFGEDTYLSSQMGIAMVKGFQGPRVSDPNHVAACLKHFLGYGSTVTGKDRTPSILPMRLIRQYDLPIFAESIRAGAKSVMLSSGEINGTPVHADKNLITDLLKGQLNFSGFVVTDWKDIIYLHTRHKVAATMREAVQKSVLAGIDMSMVPEEYSFFKHLLALVKEGAVPMSRIDDAVSRILRVKFELNLFKNPIADPDAYPKFGSKEFQKIAYRTAAESVTLLKNSNSILPLNKDVKVLVTGPTANSMKYLNGGWSYTWQGEKSDVFARNSNTVLEAFQKKLNVDQVDYAGVSFSGSTNDISKAVALAKTADVIVLCLGEPNYTETPGDINDLSIGTPQITLAKTLAKLNKPIILVLLEGRPRLIHAFEDQMEAVLQAYLPGNQGADAIVDVVFGDINPSGKLPYNYPRYPHALQKYNRKYTESLNDNEQNADAEYQRSYNPQYEFGHGLSYTNFKYENLQLSRSTMQTSDTLKIKVAVTNTGDRAGKEVVQLYLKDHYATITPEVKSLKRFKKLYLKPQERKIVHFELYAKDLGFVNKNLEWETEIGDFSVKIEKLAQTFRFVAEK